jgi:hypothetical protein
VALVTRANSRTAPASTGTARGSSPAQPADSAGTPGLDAARTTFIEAIRRDTPGTDLPRYVAVLDALLKWTAAHGGRLVPMGAVRRPAAIRFAIAGSKDAFWSAHVVPSSAPMLEIKIPSSQPASEALRADAMRTLNAHSRIALEEGDRLRIGFGALKNATALAAVLELLDRLLTDMTPAPERPT